MLLCFVPILGAEVNGATRWLGVGIGQFQPSEFLKPLFIVAIAWLLSLREQDKRCRCSALVRGDHRRQSRCC